MSEKLFTNLKSVFFSDVIIKTVSNLDDVKKEEEVKAAMKAHDSIVTEYKTLIREQVCSDREPYFRYLSIFISNIATHPHGRM